MAARVFMPRDVKTPFVRECELYGADVTLVDGLITDAGRVAAEAGAAHGWYDVSTLKEPYRVEGKKTMAYEVAEQLGWEWPDWMIYPTGGGTGIVGMWKACAELEALGWMPAGRRPRMVSVQAEGCAPIVRAFEAGADRAAPWEGARTAADGLRVPRAIGDFLILRALRESGGTALAVSDDAMVAAMREMGAAEGLSAAPEGGATLVALRALLAQGTIAPSDRVVLFNTGGALKYLDLLDRRGLKASHTHFARTRTVHAVPSGAECSPRPRASRRGAGIQCRVGRAARSAPGGHHAAGRAASSAGRALRSQRRGRGFESHAVHQ